MEEQIKRITQAEEKPQRYFFDGYLNIDFQVLSFLSLNEVFWIYNAAKHQAQQANGLSNDCLYYQSEEQIIVVKSHFGTDDLHEDYFMAKRDMTKGFVTIKFGQKKLTFQPEESEKAATKETRYFFDGLPKPSDKVADILQPQGVLELMQTVQMDVRRKGGIHTPVFEASWEDREYRLIDNMPSKYLEQETELSKLASAIHFVTIDLINDDQASD